MSHRSSCPDSAPRLIGAALALACLVASTALANEPAADQQAVYVAEEEPRAIVVSHLVPVPVVRPASTATLIRDDELRIPESQSVPEDLYVPATPETSVGQATSTALKPLDAISISIAPPRGDVPANLADDLPRLSDDLYAGPYASRPWGAMNYSWAASALWHRPLYFQELGLERYGHSRANMLQPLISGAHFFGTLPLLPYEMTLYPPLEHVYALGYYRPGDCAPRLWYRLPWSWKAAFAEGATATGLVFLLP